MAVANKNTKITQPELLAALAVVAVHVLLRAAGLLADPKLEDHDSIGYIGHARIFLSGDLSAIWTMTPDSIPLFPVLMALFSLVTGDIESGGRLVSLLASLITLCCVYLIASRMSGRWTGIIAAALIAVNPVFVRWSYSVLTEPLYVAVVLAGATILLYSLPRVSPGRAALIGAIFGLAFLTRFEGILFIAFVPVALLVFHTISKSDRPRHDVVKATAIYIAVFVFLATPQVIRVSDYMNTFSLNGRTTWSILLNAPDNRSNAEKIYGLDYDPGTINLHYLQAHPEYQSSLVTETGYGDMLAAYTKTVLINMEELHHEVISPLIGIPVLIFAAVGLFLLMRDRRYAEAFLLTAFLAVGIAAPLLHNVAPRHIAVLGPFLFVLAAIGIRETGRQAAAMVPGIRAAPATAGALLLLACTSTYILDIGRLLMRPDRLNPEYDEPAIKAAAEEFRQIVGTGDGEKPFVVARKGYFGYFAGTRTILMPFTDLNGLIRFMEVNQADHLFVESRLVNRYPFMAELDRADTTSPLVKLFSREDPRGGQLILFEVSRHQTAENPEPGR